MVNLKDSLNGIRSAVGVFESFERFLLSVQGPDRVSFLNNLLTHDIKAVTAGQGCLACLLDRQGKILFSALIHIQPEEILVETEPLFRTNVQSLLEKYQVSEKVTFAPAENRYRIIPVHGPKTLDLLRLLWPNWQLPESPLTQTAGPENSNIHWGLRWDLLGLPGIHLYVEPKQELILREKILKAGASLGAQRANLVSFEILRVEAGIPWPGKEINGTVIPNELGQDGERFVSYTKGCYIGQEIVARIKHRAHPPRRLTGFSLEGDLVPSVPCSIEHSGAPAGTLTSCYFSPGLNQVIGLGFLKYELEVPHVQIDSPQGPIQAEVTPLPFNR